MKLLRTIAVVACVLQLHAVRAEDGVLINPIPNGITDSRGIEISKAALVRRGWSIVPDADQKLVKGQMLRGNATINITIFKEGSALKYSGNHVIPINPKSLPQQQVFRTEDLKSAWVSDLKNEIWRLMASAEPAPAPTQLPTSARLAELKGLFDSGLITKEEYAAKRAELLKHF